jgi:signal transduction histidine kinase
MNSILSDYYFTGGEVFVILILIGGVGATVYWALWRSWRHRLNELEQALSNARAKYDRDYFRALHDHLQKVVSHEVVSGLDFISNRSKETLGELGEEQSNLRDKQQRIVAKASEMAQHADNITHLFALEPGALPKELLSFRQFVERVLLGLFDYAENRGVTLMPDLDDMEPIALNRDAALQALRNVIHNAIQYSYQGGVVEIVLFLCTPEEGAGRWICVDVKDTGIGIREQDQDKIFELSTGEDGLIEPNSGLGLYCARQAARRQGGDVILVSSSLNQGSTFRIIFPYGNGDHRE